MLRQEAGWFLLRVGHLVKHQEPLAGDVGVRRDDNLQFLEALCQAGFSQGRYCGNEDAWGSFQSQQLTVRRHKQKATGKRDIASVVHCA